MYSLLLLDLCDGRLLWGKPRLDDFFAAGRPGELSRGNSLLLDSHGGPD